MSTIPYRIAPRPKKLLPAAIDAGRKPAFMAPPNGKNFGRLCAGDGARRNGATSAGDHCQERLGATQFSGVTAPRAASAHLPGFARLRGPKPGDRVVSQANEHRAALGTSAR